MGMERRPGDRASESIRKDIPGISPGQEAPSQKTQLFLPLNLVCFIETEEAGANKGSQTCPAGRKPLSEAERREAFGLWNLPTGRLPDSLSPTGNSSIQLVQGHLTLFITSNGNEVAQR